MVTPILALSLLSALQAEPLPRELEYRLTLARALPAPYSGAVILALLPSARLSPRQVLPLATEAMQLAGKDTTVAARAWITYRESASKEGDAPLEFPVRQASLKANCIDLEVSDPRDYYRWAMQAGRREFTMAVSNVRSAVEVGRLAEAILDGNQDLLIGTLLTRLDASDASDREFVEAMRYTGLHNAMLKLAERSNIAVGRQILSRYRAFLVSNFSGRRCSGNRSEEFKGVIDEFNGLARQLRGVIPLDADAAQVRSVDTQVRDAMPNTFALLHKLTNSPTDDVSVRSMLTEIEQFRLEQKPGTTQSTEESRAYLYARFADRLRNTKFEPAVVEAWVHFIVYSNLRNENPRVWFRSARAFYDWSLKDGRRQSQIENAGDPALTAYIRLTTSLPESEVARVLP